MTLTDKQLYENRIKWIRFLQEPERKKATGELENFADNDARCCLGHACHVMGLERWDADTVRISDKQRIVYDGSAANAPRSLLPMLGLKDVTGPEVLIKDNFGNCYDNLANLNDFSIYTPQMIGDYLLTVIYGGEGTPFIAIDKEKCQ